MKGVCAIVLDEDKTFFSFASIKRNQPVFIQESETPLPYDNTDIVSYLRENFEILGQKMKEFERRFSFKIGKVYLVLPWDIAQSKVVQESILLRSRKRITLKDVSFAKKYIEDKFLDWDDFCLHNVVINYEVEGINYDRPPLGVWAKKIKLQSLLISVKDKLQKETQDIFGNLNRDFGCFVAPQISAFSSVFRKKEKTQVVVSIDYNKSHFIVRSKDGFIFSREFGFGLKTIIKELSDRFTLGFSLAEEVFGCYISFKEIPYFKEVTVKKDSGYINLSTQTLNSFVKEYVKSNFCSLMHQIRDNTESEDIEISFIGRLNAKEGFYGFLKDQVPFAMRAPIQKGVVSSSYGCLQYGVFPFLERDCLGSRPLLKAIANVYREYF